MVREDLKKEILEFREKKTPHLCAWCKHVWNIEYWADFSCTMLDFGDAKSDDCSVCHLVRGQYALGSGPQNARIGQGYKRQDNGSGFWVIVCPFFERMDDTLYF